MPFTCDDLHFALAWVSAVLVYSALWMKVQKAMHPGFSATRNWNVSIACCWMCLCVFKYVFMFRHGPVATYAVIARTCLTNKQWWGRIATRSVEHGCISRHITILLVWDVLVKLLHWLQSVSLNIDRTSTKVGLYYVFVLTFWSWRGRGKSVRVCAT